MRGAAAAPPGQGFILLLLPQWIIGELACYTYSMVAVPLYDTLGPEALVFIINQGNWSRFHQQAANEACVCVGGGGFNRLTLVCHTCSFHLCLSCFDLLTSGQIIRLKAAQADCRGSKMHLLPVASALVASGCDKLVQSDFSVARLGGACAGRTNPLLRWLQRGSPLSCATTRAKQKHSSRYASEAGRPS